MPIFSRRAKGFKNEREEEGEKENANGEEMIFFSSSPVGSFHDFARRGGGGRRRGKGDGWQRPAKRIYPAGGKMAVAVTTCCHFDTAARISFSRVIPTFIDDGSTRLRAIVPASIRNARFPLIYDRSEREREREREGG